MDEIFSVGGYCACAVCGRRLSRQTGGCAVDCAWNPDPEVVDDLNHRAPSLAIGRAEDERHADRVLAQDVGGPVDPGLALRTAVRWLYERDKLRALCHPNAVRGVAA